MLPILNCMNYPSHHHSRGTTRHGSEFSPSEHTLTNTLLQRCFHPETSRTHEYHENISKHELLLSCLKTQMSTFSEFCVSQACLPNPCKWKQYMNSFKNQVKITRGLWLGIRKWISLSHKTYLMSSITESPESFIFKGALNARKEERKGGRKWG